MTKPEFVLTNTIEEVTMMGYKFNSHRYITCGVAAEIPLDIQLMLFESIEVMREKVQELDWLQIMKLEGITKDGVSVLRILHEQEVPEGHIEYYLPYEFEGKQTVYVIDDVDHVTMLLKSEY